MAMTIKALGSEAVRFSPTLRCRIAEMVNRRPETFSPKEGVNELGEILPYLHYVDEGLSLFKEVYGEFKHHRALLLECRNLYQLIMTSRPVDTQEKSTELKMAVLALNVLRTSFTDQLCNNSPLIQERLNALKTLNADLPELSFATQQFATSYSHPVIDNSDEVMAEVREQLGYLTGRFYHQHFFRHCLQFPRNNTVESLIPEEENELIPTMTSDYCWPISFYTLDTLNVLDNAIDLPVVESVRENLDQCIALRNLTLRPTDVKKKQREEFPKLLIAWKRVAEQVRLLLFVTDLFLPVTESAVNVMLLRLNGQILNGDDKGLEAIVIAKLTPLLDRARKNEQ